jgi:hypothetical protein
MPPAQLNVDTLVAAFKDARVIEALTQALVPCLQTIIKPIVDSVYAEMKQEIDDQRNVIGSLECENIELRRRVKDLEAYSRIDNLVIHGLPEQYAESAATTSSVESDSNVSSEQQFIKFCESSFVNQSYMSLLRNLISALLIDCQENQAQDQLDHLLLVHLLCVLQIEESDLESWLLRNYCEVTQRQRYMSMNICLSLQVKCLLLPGDYIITKKLLVCGHTMDKCT